MLSDALVKHHCDLQRDAFEARHLHHQPLFKIPAIRGQTVKARASHWRRRCSNDAVVDFDADVVQRSVTASGLVVTYDVASSRQRHRLLDDVVAAASSSCDETSATCRQAKVRTRKLLHNLKLLGQRPQCYVHSTAKHKGSELARQPAVLGLILGAPKNILLMLLRFIDGTA